MRVHKKVLSHDSGEWLLCCWYDCEKQGYEIYHATEKDGPKLVKYVFCSERHREYFLNSHRNWGNARSGVAPIFL